MDGENPAATPAAGDNVATGDDRVDEAIAPLGKLADVPVEDHPAVLDEVHQRLGGILAQLDEDQR
jgi:hypothetical protein